MIAIVILRTNVEVAARGLKNIRTTEGNRFEFGSNLDNQRKDLKKGCIKINKFLGEYNERKE
jgi:hypothetical protein